MFQIFNITLCIYKNADSNQENHNMYPMIWANPIVPSLHWQLCDKETQNWGNALPTWSDQSVISINVNGQSWYFVLNGS
jgi:hypothetical protein